MSEIDLQLIMIKTLKGIYLTDNIKLEQSRFFSSQLSQYWFDDKKALPTFSKDWMFVPTLPKTVKCKTSLPTINRRYELQVVSMASDVIPLSFPAEQVIEDGEWKKEYAHLKSLYMFKYDLQSDVLKSLSFEFVQTLELDELKEFNGFSYPVANQKKITEKDVMHQVFDKILFPPVVLPSRPCKLTSCQSYDIVRKHVQDNIDPKIATITSDYDFCFTVMKKIEKAEPEEYKTDINSSFFGKRKSKPKMVTKFRTHRKIEVFNMTWSPKNYEKYIPIKPFEGKNIEELCENIATYLVDLIANINEPVKDCPHCKGMGVWIGYDI